MNVFKAVYCNQYYELKPKGKEDSARSNGTRLLIVSTALNIILIVVLAMVISEDFLDAFTDLIEDIFGRRRGRSIGRLVAIVPFIIVLPIVRYTLGTESSYNSTISEFESLSDQDQLVVSKKGLRYFIGSLIGFGVAFAMALIFLA